MIHKELSSGWIIQNFLFSLDTFPKILFFLLNANLIFYMHFLAPATQLGSCQGTEAEEGQRSFGRNPWLIEGQLGWESGQNHGMTGPVPGLGGHEHLATSAGIPSRPPLKLRSLG